MSEWLGFGSDLPWWGWMFLVIGIVAFVSVVAALFFPDWADDDYTVGFEAPPGSDQFVEWTSTFLNVPIYDGGEVTLLQNGDRFFPAMLNAIREAKDSVHFETYIFSPDEIGRQFIDALKERAQAGVEVRLLLDAFGAIRLKKRHRQELRSAGVSLSSPSRRPALAWRMDSPPMDPELSRTKMVSRGIGLVRAPALGGMTSAIT